MNKTTKEWIELYLDEIGSKYDEDIQVRPKRESKLLRFVRPIVEVFNKNFWDGYITTIGSTIWVPDDFLENGSVKSRLQVVAHEVFHVKQAKRFSMPLFAILYLFPQILAPLALFAFLAIPFGINWLWCLLFLLCLAPLPAPFRYMFELEAYRVKILFYRHAWTSTPEAIEWVKDGIAGNLSRSDYYFAWPFRRMIVRNLNKEEKLNDNKYKEILAFLKDNNLEGDLLASP